MRVNVRFRFVVPVFLLSLSLAGCAMEEKQAESAEPNDSEAKNDQAPQPKTPEDFLDRAEEAMQEGVGWTFSVTGREGLTFQGQASTASYEATVDLGQDPEAFHAQGTVTSKGTSHPEEIFVIDDVAYIKKGNEEWKRSPASDPETKSKVEDPLAAIETFREYLQESTDDVTLAKRDGRVQLQVRIPSRKFPEVQDRAFAKKAMRELDSTLEQLKAAGVAVNEKQLILSRLEETLTLDAGTHQIEAHRFKIRFLIPYGNQNMIYEKDVREEARGMFEGNIKLPAGAK